MVICTRRTLAVYKYKENVDEIEWTRARNALEFLDLADHNKLLFEFYNARFHSISRYFKSPWIFVCSLRKHYPPLDDCRVLFMKWFCDYANSIFLHPFIQKRDPDWFGRNIFLEYIRQKIDKKNPKLLLNEKGPFQPETGLEWGESAVHFFKLAELCGFENWRKTTVCGMPASDCIFKSIYPSILRGLYRNRERYPLLAKKLLDMFCVTFESRTYLFSSIPDKQHLEFLLGVANRTPFNFWGFRDGIHFHKILSKFIDQKRFELITVLLIHGFTTDQHPLTLIISLNQYFPKDNLTHSMELLRLLEAGWQINPNSNNLRALRNYLKHLVQQNNSSPGSSTEPELEEMFRALFASVPLRLQSSPKKIFDLTNNRSSKFQGLVNAYETWNIGIKDGTVYKLKHLCRSVVRQRLRDNFQLPTGIYALKLPNLIKKYLNLDFPIPT